MAIFGWNGFMALSVYLATLFGVYGTKNASFKNTAEFATIQRLIDRKRVAETKGKRLTYYVLRYELFLYAGQLLYWADEAENWWVTAPRVR